MNAFPHPGLQLRIYSIYLVDVEIQQHTHPSLIKLATEVLLQHLPIFREQLQSVRSNHWPKCTQHNCAWAKTRFQWPGCIRRLRHSGQEKNSSSTLLVLEMTVSGTRKP
jgi:hypothetical protein